MARSHSIAFDFLLDNSRVKIELSADVDLHHSQHYYVIRNLKMSRQVQGPVLPDILIKRANGRWVHLESGKETDLSAAVGKAIDEYEAN